MQGSIGSSNNSIANASSIEVPVSIAKQIFELIKKGDIEAVRQEASKAGNGNPASILPYMFDDRFHHNAIFYAAIIKDEVQCVKMIEFLISQGVEAASVD